MTDVASVKRKYTVSAYENSESPLLFIDEGSFDSADEAIRCAEAVIDRSLAGFFTPGMCADTLRSSYSCYGEVPAIFNEQGLARELEFDTYVYVYRRIRELTGESEWGRKVSDLDEGEVMTEPMWDKPAQSGENSPQLLLDTLNELMGITDLKIDADGDIGIRCGSALAFCRFVDDPPHVRIYSRLLSEVDESPEVFARLNDINDAELYMRFIFRAGSVFATADICAAPFVSAHVTQALVHFCTIANRMDSLLQEEFGGQTAFPDSLPSSTMH